jgi:hypothetical protein
MFAEFRRSDTSRVGLWSLAMLGEEAAFDNSAHDLVDLVVLVELLPSE